MCAFSDTRQGQAVECEASGRAFMLLLAARGALPWSAWFFKSSCIVFCLCLRFAGFLSEDVEERVRVATFGPGVHETEAR